MQAHHTVRAYTRASLCFCNRCTAAHRVQNVTTRGPEGRRQRELKCYNRSDPDHCNTTYRLYVHLVCL